MPDLQKLFEPFAKDAISWRAQHVTKEPPHKALALAYIDARDVMNRLDDVCGIDGWQCKYSHANGKTICDIGIFSEVHKEWIWKADGAGDTDIEAEKGAISDAFKRAAVKWGVGRYLYNLDAVWVPCDTKELNGKVQFVKFKDDCWKYVKADQKAGFETARQQNAKWIGIKDKIICAESSTELQKVWDDHQPELNVFKRGDPEIFDQLERAKNTRKIELQQETAMMAGMPNGFNEVRK